MRSNMARSSSRMGALPFGWRQETLETGQPWLHLDWKESGVEMPSSGAEPKGSGQGRELIERVLPDHLTRKRHLPWTERQIIRASPSSRLSTIGSPSGGFLPGVPFAWEWGRGSPLRARPTFRITADQWGRVGASRT